MKTILFLASLLLFNSLLFPQNTAPADFDNLNQLNFAKGSISEPIISRKLASLPESASTNSERLMVKVRQNQSAVKQAVAPLKKELAGLLKQKKALQSAGNKSALAKIDSKISEIMTAYFAVKESELMIQESSLIPAGDQLNSRIAQRVIKTVELMNEKHQQIEPLIGGDRSEIQPVCKREINKIWLYPVKKEHGWQVIIVAQFKNFSPETHSSIPDLIPQSTAANSTVFDQMQSVATKQGRLKVESSSQKYPPRLPVDRPKIMLTGYWNPTGQMISSFSQDLTLNPAGWQGSNWEALGYDVVSFFPKPDVYTGTFMVDYQNVSADFWEITGQVKPIAIISFGAGNGPWEIEVNARNLTSWYADDVAPVMPTPNPPDNAKPTGYNRLSTLPVADIAALVNTNTTINAWVDWNGNPGKYLCEFMAYHDKWYYEINRLKTEDPCLASGFIHALNTIPVSECQTAVHSTLRATINHLKKFIPVAGQVTIPGQSPVGTYLSIKGSENLSFPITSESGQFTLPYILPGTYQISAVKEGIYYNSQQITVSDSSNYFTIELKDWSTETAISYHQAADQIYQQTAYNPQEVAIKITPAEFAGFGGGILDKIQFYTPLSSDSCTIAMIVYSGNLQAASPATIEYVKTISNFSANQWFVHYLETPVVLDLNKNYWLGYRISSTITKKVGWLDNAPAVTGKGFWQRSNGAWSSTLVNHNWLIDCSVYQDVTGIESEPLPGVLNLQNYPNPFNPVTTVSFNLTKAAEVVLTVYNARGEQLKRLVNSQLEPGVHSYNFDGSSLNSGVYFTSLKVNGEVINRKMVMLK